MLRDEIIAVRGGGDLATGAVQKLWRSGFRVVVLEVERPLAVRRSVSLCTAVTNGEASVEDMTARLAAGPADCFACWSAGIIPVMIDPCAEKALSMKPSGLVDAILAKRNIGTSIDMAPVVIALGPGFEAGTDCHAVIETIRGHNLGRVILSGRAAPNTGIPGEIGGKSAERVLHAPRGGIVRAMCSIGEIVREGDIVLTVDGEPVAAPIAGLIRGLIENETFVPRGTKIADIDPRTGVDWRTISDKARCVGGGALEAYLMLRRKAGAL